MLLKSFFNHCLKLFILKILLIKLLRMVIKKYNFIFFNIKLYFLKYIYIYIYMLSQDKFHKLCKYSLRLEKSFISGNVNNSTKYCSHLKHHIGGDNDELNKMFENLIKIIIEKQTDTSGNIVNYDTLIKVNEQLEINTKNNESTIGELRIANNELNEKNNELNVKMEKYEDIIDTIDSKLNEINGDKSIKNVEYKKDLNNALEQFKNKLQSTIDTKNANDQIIINNNNKISDLEQEIVNLKKEIENKILNTKNEDVVEFKTKLEEILKIIYGDELAKEIIEGANPSELQPENIENENKLNGQDIENSEEKKKELLESEFDIYNTKKNGFIKKSLNFILDHRNIQNDPKDNKGTKIQTINKFKNDVNKLLKIPTEPNVKQKIQKLIDEITGPGINNLRISNGGKLVYGGNFE
jgi:hypothetical protein